MVIGKGGSEVEALRKALNDITGKRVHVNIFEIKQADVDAKLVAENIARQLENRVSFRRAMKQAIQRAMRAGAKGIKTASSQAVLAELISLVVNIIVKELFLFTLFVQTSITVLLKQTQLTVSYRCKNLDLPW